MIKAILKTLAIVFVALWIVRDCHALAFVAISAGGDWNTPSTWSKGGGTCGVGYPCVGDTVTLPSTASGPVTCTGVAEVCSVGQSAASNTTSVVTITGTTNGNTVLKIGDGDVFITFGSWICPYVTVEMDGTAKFIVDQSRAASPTTAAYVIEMGTSGNTESGTWNILGTSTSARADLNGDTFADTYTCSTFGTCKAAGTCLSANTCISGGIGYPGASQGNDQNNGVFNHVVIENFGATGGPTFSSQLTAMAWSANAKSTTGVDTVFTNDQLVNVSTNGSGGTWTMNNFQMLNTAVAPTQPYGCYNVQDTSTAGTYSIINAVFSCGHKPSFQNARGFLYRNIFYYSDQLNANSKNTVTGICGNSSLDNWDQNFVYWNTSGTSSYNACSGSASTIAPATMHNSIHWRETNYGASQTSAWMDNGAVWNPYSGLTPTTVNEQNNVYGGMGQAALSAPFNNHTGAGVPTTTPWIFNHSNSVILPGYNKLASMNIIRAAGAVGSLTNPETINVNNNTSATDGTNASDVVSYGNVGFNALGAIAAGTFASVSNNLFVRFDSPGWINEVCANGSATNAVNAITSLNNNALGNDNINTSSNAICTNSSTGGTNKIPATGPTGDVVISRLPVFVNPNASIPNFDTLYLIPAGLVTVATTYCGGVNASCSAGVPPAWSSSSVSYTVGNIVSDQQASVYSNAVTYWICIQNNTSASTNRPVTGVAAGSPSYNGHNQFWMEAWIVDWLEPNVLAGTTYNDGALLVNSQGVDSATANGSGLYAIGVVNAFLRHQFISLEPTLWAGCASGTECGALQLTPIQHIPPPMSMP